MRILNITKKKTFAIFILLIITMISGCTWYKTLQIEPINAESLEAIHKHKNTVVIHNAIQENEYTLRNEMVLTNFVIENDSLKGITIAPPAGRKHQLKDNSFIKSSVEAYQPLSTMHIYIELPNMDFGEFSIPISAIKSVEIHDKNVGKSVSTSILSIVGAASVVMVAAVAVACACPQVSSYNEKEDQFHGSLFPGSIFKSLKRHDYLVLDNTINDQGSLNLQISNDLPEIEYIDQLELLEVKHEKYDHLGVSNTNQFVAYNEKPTPLYFESNLSDEMAFALQKRDHLSYDFNDPNSINELNNVVLKFKRSDFSENTKLVITGKQSQWLETVANYVFFNIGKSYDNWKKRKDKASAKKWKQKNVKQGVALNVYQKINNTWKYIGSHHDAGTLAMRNLVMNIEHGSDSSSFIEIKLESAYKIWEIDYVGLTDDWTNEVQTSTINFDAVIDQDGNDISQAIKSTDENYHVQDSIGTSIDLSVKGYFPNHNSTLVLHGSGYYHHIRDYEHKPDLKFFVQLNNKLGIQDVSRALDQYQSFMATASVD